MSSKTRWCSWLRWFAAGIITLAVQVVSQDYDYYPLKDDGAAPTTGTTFDRIAANTDTFGTLVTAVRTAHLDDDLAAQGPFSKFYCDE